MRKSPLSRDAFPLALRDGAMNASLGAATLGTLPFVLLLIEGLIAWVFAFLAICSFATIYLAFVGLLLYAVGLFVCGLLNVFGAVLSLTIAVVGHRQLPASIPALLGLAAHLLLGSLCFGMLCL